MTRKTFFNIGAALFLSVGLAGSAFAQEKTPTPTPSPMPSPMESPSPMPLPSPMESPSPSPSPMPSPMESPSPNPSPTPAETTAPTEAPKTAEAVTNISNTGTQKKQASTETVASTYEVPLLNVPGFNNKETEIKVNFAGELKGLKGKAYIKQGKDGTSQIKMRFDDMKMAPKDKRYVLWAVAPDKTYTKIGQVVNSGAKQESEIRGETAITDFGLFVTIEDTDVAQPAGTTYAPIKPGM